MWIKRVYAKKWVKIPYLIGLYSFAIYGAFLASVYVAMKFKLTQESGQLDVNNRYFQEMSDKYDLSFRVDSTFFVKKRFEVLDRIVLLNDYYPTNAKYILNAYKKTNDERIALKMLDAVDLRLRSDKNYLAALKELRGKKNDRREKVSALSAYEWMNVPLETQFGFMCFCMFL